MLIYSYVKLSLLFLGFLHVSLKQQVDSSILGNVHLPVSTPTWNTWNICPTGLTNNQNTEEKLLSVVGEGSGLSFTVQIAEGASEIALNEPQTVNVKGDEVSVFQFIPPQGISDKQLDITATSQSKVAAYLKVSQNCKEVDLQEDLESIDYKKESLRLSFATKGRITLSRVSIPPLTDSVSRWFIGIVLKNVSGDVKLSESKNVTLKLTRSFDYNYATPICVLFFVSFVVGLLVSIVAYYLFEESLIQVKPGEGNLVNNNPDFKISYRDLWEVIMYDWFSSGPDTSSYITVIVGVVLMIGASQFVFSKWYTMIREGDRDSCFYNDFCYRVANHDIPFNLMISNLTYIIHGLILAVWVLLLETKVKLRCKSRAANVQGSRQAEDIHCSEERISKPKKTMKAEEKEEEKEISYCFSIGYAYSWAMVFQGLFSALYHLCPSRVTFQFDSAFMFIMSGLTVMLLYNGIEQNRDLSSENVKPPVGAAKFFLFVIVPLFIFNFFVAGVNSDSGLNRFFLASLIAWSFMMVSWAFSRLDIKKKLGSVESKDKCDAILFFLGSMTLPCGIFIFYMVADLSLVFLFACITSSFMAILAKARPWEMFCKCECARECACPKTSAKYIFRVIFNLLTVIVLVAAFVVFMRSPTTDKTLSPESSRDQNGECVIFGFFDWHDLWHFLSSFALLMGAFVIMSISSAAEQSPQAKTRGNNEPGAQGTNSAEIST